MKIALIALLVVHGSIHLLGVAKAFGLAEIAALHDPMSKSLGALWALAGVAFFASAIVLLVSPGHWWIAAAPAIVASQIAIATSWSDAKAGTAANLLIVVPLAIALLDLRSSSFKAIYREQVDRGLSRWAPTAQLTEADVARLPAPVQVYLRRANVIGRPRVHNVRARWRGVMRSKPDGAWMPIRAEQVDFFDEPSRIFLMEASRGGLPFEALHLYVDSSATMRVRVGSLVDVVDARGPRMTRSETVTLFNDMCVLAPGSLVDADVRWTSIDDRKVGATFSNAGNTISAELSFSADGDLVGFSSNDRDQTDDGKTYRNFPWSTPLRDYHDFGGARLASHGDATWREPQGEWVYAQLELEEIQYNVGPRP